MRLAEHFAVGAVGGAALAPGGHVVGIHVGEFPDFGLVRIVGHGTVGAVGVAFGLRLGGL